MGLIQLFESTRIFEPGRTGWDSVMAATHPPMELRIDAILKRFAEDEDEFDRESSILAVATEDIDMDDSEPPDAGAEDS